MAKFEEGWMHKLVIKEMGGQVSRRMGGSVDWVWLERWVAKLVEGWVASLVEGRVA